MALAREGVELVISARGEERLLPPFTGDYSAIERDDREQSLALTFLSPVEFMRATVGGITNSMF